MATNEARQILQSSFTAYKNMPAFTTKFSNDETVASLITTAISLQLTITALHNPNNANCQHLSAFGQNTCHILSSKTNEDDKSNLCK